MTCGGSNVRGPTATRVNDAVTFFDDQKAAYTIGADTVPPRLFDIGPER